MADGLKDRKLQDYYESMGAMYSSKGWDYLVEDLTKILEEANTLNGVDSMESLHFRRGQIDIIHKIITQPAVIEVAYQTLLDDDLPI